MNNITIVMIRAGRNDLRAAAKNFRISLGKLSKVFRKIYAKHSKICESVLRINRDEKQSVPPTNQASKTPTKDERYNYYQIRC